MAATPEKPAPAAPRRKVGRHRGEGQWALGHYTPLNGNEQFKKDDDSLNVRTRIETIYSKRGFDSIDPNDLRGRMRWWGLYTQRKAGIDGGKTAVLEPEELEDKYFMMRVRIDGGKLTTEQLRVIGEISQEYARGSADITDRQNVQMHWIRIEDVPAIWQKLEAVGLSTTEACGDCPRTMIGSPVAGIAADEIIDGTPALEEIHARYIGSPEFSNLPGSSRPRSPDPRSRTSSTRSTTSPSWASNTPSTDRASTSGSVAGSPPTPGWPSAWAPGCRWTRSRTSGPAWWASSGTTATAGCATGPG